MTILLVDDHDLVLKGMTAVLREHFREAELLPAADGRQAVEVAVNYDIDLAILDLELPDMSGFDLIERLRGISPGIKIVVNTVHEEIWAMNRLRQCAVDGTVFKSVDSSALVQTVRNVLEGLPSSCQAGSGPGVSSKELEVLRLIADGLDSQSIATRLFISINTVESHRSHLMRKLRASNAADMVMKAVSLGLIPPAHLKKML